MKKKIVVLIPAYNSEKTIGQIIERIPKLVNKIIIVDDGSSDKTAEVAGKYKKVKVAVHKKNKGYGGAQKTLMNNALEENADICVFVHSDGGHAPEEIPQVIAPLLEGKVQVVNGSRAKKIIIESRPFLGSKFIGGLLSGPMPWWRFFGNRFLSRLQNIICGTNVDDFHSGFRACTREVLQTINYKDLYEGHGFDAEILLEMCRKGYKIESMPVSTHYDPDIHSTVKPIRYGLRVLWFILKNNRFMNKINNINNK